MYRSRTLIVENYRGITPRQRACPPMEGVRLCYRASDIRIYCVTLYHPFISSGGWTRTTDIHVNPPCLTNSGGWTRTTDIHVNSVALYQLNYPRVRRAGSVAEPVPDLFRDTNSLSASGGNYPRVYKTIYSQP